MDAKKEFKCDVCGEAYENKRPLKQHKWRKEHQTRTCSIEGHRNLELEISRLKSEVAMMSRDVSKLQMSVKERDVEIEFLRNLLEMNKSDFDEI